MTGGRKFKIVWMTYIMLALLMGGAMFTGVVFSGEEIFKLSFLIAGIGATFFGANVGEHFADAMKVKNGKV